MEFFRQNYTFIPVLCFLKSKLLKRSKCNSHFNPILYSRFLGKAAVNHTRMRLGLSALNSQRYKYNMVPSPSCERCGTSKEDPYHIFFVCPAYAVPRQTLTQDLNRILSVDILQNKKTIEIILLYGSEILDHHTNLILFTALHDFIYSCGIFNNLSSSQLFHSSHSYILSSYCIIFFSYIFFPCLYFSIFCVTYYVKKSNL